MVLIIHSKDDGRSGMALPPRMHSHSRNWMAPPLAVSSAIGKRLLTTSDISAAATSNPRRSRRRRLNCRR